jgi:hypothetical protein
MRRHVVLVRTGVSEERAACIIRVKRISEIGTILAVMSRLLQLQITANVSSEQILFTLIMVILSSETSVVAKATGRHISEYGILHSRRSENLKFYIALIGWAL